MNLEEKHFRIYREIAALLLFSYIGFGFAFLGGHVFKWWIISSDNNAEKIVLAFIWGALGGTSFCTVHFVKEVNDHQAQKAHCLMPHCLEPFGYVLFIIGSGFTGILLLALVHAGFLAAYNAADISKISDMAIFVIGFVGGYSTERVKTLVGKLGSGMMSDAKLPSEKKQQTGQSSEPAK